MNEEIYREYNKIFIEMVRALGIDATDDCLRQELTEITKKVICLREHILNMKNTVYQKTNSDELNHLKYDIEDAEKLLSLSLSNLDAADKRYSCFQEYLRRIKGADS